MNLRCHDAASASWKRVGAGVDQGDGDLGLPPNVTNINPLNVKEPIPKAIEALTLKGHRL